jgi:hypothetical protein
MHVLQSTTHIWQMLWTKWNFFGLVELARNLFGFDRVFGLREGWWLFNDRREHALADERWWNRCLREVRFKWIGWSNSQSRESDPLRGITGSKQKISAEVKVLLLFYFFDRGLEESKFLLVGTASQKNTSKWKGRVEGIFRTTRDLTSRDA